MDFFVHDTLFTAPAAPSLAILGKFYSGRFLFIKNLDLLRNVRIQSTVHYCEYANK
jgi:hypothetical protein